MANLILVWKSWFDLKWEKKRFISIFKTNYKVHFYSYEADQIWLSIVVGHEKFLVY